MLDDTHTKVHSNICPTKVSTSSTMSISGTSSEQAMGLFVDIDSSHRQDHRPVSSRRVSETSTTITRGTPEAPASGLNLCARMLDTTNRSQGKPQLDVSFSQRVSPQFPSLLQPSLPAEQNNTRTSYAHEPHAKSKLQLQLTSNDPEQAHALRHSDVVKGKHSGIMVLPKKTSRVNTTGGQRLNKFVSRLHAMISAEKDAGLVEWRHGLLVLLDTDTFAKRVLPKYFNTKNFKTFRRQLNYYGFVHVRSFANGSASTTALWVNRELAKTANKNNNDEISSVFLLKRVEPCESAKTAEGRRVRKELALSTVELGLGVSAKVLQSRHVLHPGKSRSASENRVTQALQDCRSNGSAKQVDCSAVPSVISCLSSDPLWTQVEDPSRICEGEHKSLDLEPPKPPSSSASVANLLLLLSKA